METLRAVLENCPPEEKIFIISEGVFSMEGDIADMRGILKLAKPYGSPDLCDEAHGIGSPGATAQARPNTWESLDDVDIVMGRSRVLASVGGFIAGEKTVVDI